MQLKQFLKNIQTYWGYYASFLCILVGGLLIKPVFRLVPVLFNLTFTKSASNELTLWSIGDDSPESDIHHQTRDGTLLLTIPDQTNRESIEQKEKDESSLSTMDFSPNGFPISLTIKTMHGEKASEGLVEILFSPGEQCVYGDGQACVFSFYLPNEVPVFFASAHSGIGSEGEPFRDLVEGTGINRALLTEKQVLEKTQSIVGSEVIIKQGETIIPGLALTAIVRIPPAHVDTYLSLPIEFALDYVVNIGALDPEILTEDIFAFETCGWQLPGEESDSNYSSTSQSIYLGIIQ
ncbi:MAG: hypothetical protein GX142_09990 [Chloroflexi bacterium]|nr:hypothetical protein [Chloroflexota bacterium]